MCRSPKVLLLDIFRKQLFSSSALSSQLGKLRPKEGWGLALGLFEVMTEL